jgi:hypothetical protein
MHGPSSPVPIFGLNSFTNHHDTTTPYVRMYCIVIGVNEKEQEKEKRKTSTIVHGWMLGRDRTGQWPTGRPEKFDRRVHRRTRACL